MMSRIVAHVDVAALEVAAELVRRPELAGVPMVVGGGDRGAVLSANHHARTFGIEGGMSSARARRLCPHLVVVPPDPDHYRKVAEAIVAVCERYSDRVEPAGEGEVFVELSGGVRRAGDAGLVGERLRAVVFAEQGVWCSVGIAPNKFVAKLASAAAGPTGVRVVRSSEVIDFLHPMPVEVVRGVGRATADTLHRLGLATVREVAELSPEVLCRVLGERQGRVLAELVWGRDERLVIPRSPREHSVGSQHEFGRDTDDVGLVERVILGLCERVAASVRAQGMVGRVAVLTLRFADLTSISRSATLTAPSDLTGVIHAEVLRVFRRLHLQRARVRRVGIRLEGLTARAATWQQVTLDAPERGWAEVEAAVDRAVLRFGPSALCRASLTAVRE